MPDEKWSILSEQPISLRDVQRVHPQRPSAACVRNWCNQGLLNRQTGERVYLESYLNGSRRYTSLEALRRFTIALNEADSVAQLERMEAGRSPEVSDSGMA